MSARLLRLGLLSLTLGLSACASGPRGAEVTRFHLDQAIARGTITVEPLAGQDARSLEFQTYAQAVEAELRQLGFTIQPNLRNSEQVAVVDVERGVRPGAPSRAPLSIGIGGGTFGSNVGVGLGTSFGLGKPRDTSVVLTSLSVQLKRRSDSSVVWEGRALIEDPGQRMAPVEVVTRLARALFKDFPGVSGQTVVVK